MYINKVHLLVPSNSHLPFRYIVQSRRSFLPREKSELLERSFHFFPPPLLRDTLCNFHDRKEISRPPKMALFVASLNCDIIHFCAFNVDTSATPINYRRANLEWSRRNKWFLLAFPSFPFPSGDTSASFRILVNHRTGSFRLQLDIDETPWVSTIKN